MFSLMKSLGDEDLVSLTVFSKLMEEIFFAVKLLGALQKLLTVFQQNMPESLHMIHMKI